MKLKTLLLTITSAALLATNAKAVIYNDLDVFNKVLIAGDNPLTNSLTNYFWINEQDIDGINDAVGYDPSQQIYSAIATFSFLDDGLFGDSAAESYSINLGSLAPAAFATDEWQFILPGGLSGSGSAMVDLRADGILAYTIKATTGDFKVLSASLTVVAGAGVPDGGTTALLLGIGFLGIYAAQRKFALAR